jgi:hypothetical protein
MWRDANKGTTRSHFAAPLAGVFTSWQQLYGLAEI